MVSLRQVSSVTVQSPWSDYNPNTNIVADGMTSQVFIGSIINPFYPIFIFNYPNVTYSQYYISQFRDFYVTAYVSGNNAGILLNHAMSNYHARDAFYFTIFGYPYAMGGGFVSGLSNCMNGVAPWWTFVNLHTGLLNTYCSGFIPNNNASGPLLEILADLVQQNILILNLSMTPSTVSYAIIIWTIPVSEIATLLQNSPPPSMKFVYATAVGISNGAAIKYSALIYDGNLVIGYFPAYETQREGSTVIAVAYWTQLLFWVTSLTQIYSTAMSGVPNSSMPLANIGVVYSYDVGGIYTPLPHTFPYDAVITLIAVPVSGGIDIYISFGMPTAPYQVQLVNISPSNWSVVSSYLYPTPYITSNLPCTYAIATAWNGVFVGMMYGGLGNCNTLAIYVIDPKTYNHEHTIVVTPQPNTLAVVGHEGYIAISQQPLNNPTVTFIIYQILLDHTYIFQNIVTETTGSTITVSGMLYDETVNAPVANATVWLTIVRSIVGLYSNDVILLASGTTNDNGQFTISAPLQSGYQYYGVLYTP